MMAQGFYMQDLPDLPELPELAPLREEYCSHKILDAAVQILLCERPELLRELAGFESASDIVAVRRGNHIKICDLILDFLEAQPHGAGQDVYPATPLGRLDLLFEITRRIRTALNLAAVEPIGRPLAAKRDGDYPALPAVAVEQTKLPAESVTQETADNILEQLYSAQPALFFDCAEATRLFLFPSEIREGLERALWNMRPENQKNNGAFLGVIIRNLHARLDRLCGFSEEMKRRGYI
jgi:hypothetical protein